MLLIIYWEAEDAVEAGDVMDSFLGGRRGF